MRRGRRTRTTKVPKKVARRKRRARARLRARRMRRVVKRKKVRKRKQMKKTAKKIAMMTEMMRALRVRFCYPQQQIMAMTRVAAGVLCTNCNLDVARIKTMRLACRSDATLQDRPGVWWYHECYRPVKQRKCQRFPAYITRGS